MLDYVALFLIFCLIVALAAVIVFIGSIPGKIARRRGHPWPDAVAAAGWIGLATGVLWPLAFVWAFLPVPARPGDDSSDRVGGFADLEKRIAVLEDTVEELRSQKQAGTP